jgi:hypothetical protein
MSLVGFNGPRTIDSLQSGLPPNYDNVTAHFDTANLLYTDGDDVSQWLREIGSSLYQDQTFDQPTYVESGINGKPSIVFDGAQDDHLTSSGLVNQPAHMFLVIKMKKTTGENIVVGSDNDSEAIRFVKGSSQWKLKAGSEIAGGAIDTNPHVASALFDQGNSELRIDGTQVAGPADGTVGSQNTDNLTFGAESGGEYFEISEAVIYGQDMSSSVESIESYLGDKWGITV